MHPRQAAYAAWERGSVDVRADDGTIAARVEYASWDTPHPADAGALHRAIVRVASAYGTAAWMAAHHPESEYARDSAADARSLAFFTVAAVAERDVCDLDAALAAAERALGPAEQRYYAAIMEYIGPDR